MSSSVTLAASVRANLLSLQDTAALTATTQNRLATGLKVASALDSPVSFFSARALSARSSDLGGLLDGIANGVQAIQAANHPRSPSRRPAPSPVLQSTSSRFASRRRVSFPHRTG